MNYDNENHLPMILADNDKRSVTVRDESMVQDFERLKQLSSQTPRFYQD
jgi:hypothetical protein